MFMGYVSFREGTNIAMAGTWTRIEDVFPIEHGDIPAIAMLF